MYSVIDVLWKHGKVLINKPIVESIIFQEASI